MKGVASMDQHILNVRIKHIVLRISICKSFSAYIIDIKIMTVFLWFWLRLSCTDILWAFYVEIKRFTITMEKSGCFPF